MLNFKTTKLFLFISILNTSIILLTDLKGLTASAVSSKSMTEDRLSQSERAFAYNRQGFKLWQEGKIRDAISIWDLEKEIYQKQNLERREIETVLKISSGYTTLGQFELASFYLESLLPLAEGKNDLEGRIWEQLGNVANRNGKLSEAILHYRKSLTYKESLSTLNNLATSLKKRSFRWQLLADNSIELERGQYEAKAALDNLERRQYLERAFLTAKTKTNLSVIKTSIEWSEYEPLSQTRLVESRKLLKELSPSKTKVFLLINWAKIENPLYWLIKARDTASNLSEKAILSYPLLELGLLSEKMGDDEKAIEYAREAVTYASKSRNDRVLYRSLWLIARLEKKVGQKAAAVQSYHKAIASLGDYYDQTSSISAEQRLDFANSTEPLYREALQLIFEEELSQERLGLALEIFNRLQLAQLQQFFGDDCFSIERRKENATDILLANDAVLLTSIILQDETHFILQLPDGQLIHRPASIDKDSLSELATQWYGELENILNRQFRDKGKQMYDFILRPFEPELEDIDPKSIIFVHDGILRNIPMSALYDGERFVAQKWASITSTGLDFSYRRQTNSPTENRENDLMAFGLGVQVRNWFPLSGISEEIEAAIDLLGGKKVLNDDFTTEAFIRELKTENYNIVHLATHAYFGGTAENSFVLAYDRPLYTNIIEQALLPHHDLLVLSGCETALGSDRSTLGLAGLGLRNGIDSIGSLWRIQDEEQVELIKSFYSQIQDTNLSGAIALQKVQIEQIHQEADPSKWAALVFMESF